MLHVSKKARNMIFLLIAMISIAALISVLLTAAFSPLRIRTEQPPEFCSHHFWSMPTTGYSISCGLSTGNDGYILAGRLVDFQNNSSSEPFIDQINKTDFSKKIPVIKILSYYDFKIQMNVSPYSINDIYKTKDKGYIAVGKALAGNGTQSYFYMAKMNQSLVPEPDWERAYSPGEGLSVIQTSDLGYVAVGCSYDNNGNANHYIVKTDQYGNIKWHYPLGRPGKYTVVKQLKDGSIVTGGYAIYRGCSHVSGTIIAFNTKGCPLPCVPGSSSNASWGMGPHEMDLSINDLTESSDHNIWAVGAAKQDNNHSSGWLLKVNSSVITRQLSGTAQIPFPNGTLEMFYKFNNNSYNNFTFINRTNDGGFIIGGQTGNGSRSNAINSILLLKIDREGKILWAQSYKLDRLLEYDTCSRLGSVQQIDDDKYFFAATNYDSNSDFWNDSNGAIWGALLNPSETQLPDILGFVGAYIFQIIAALAAITAKTLGVLNYRQTRRQ